MGRIYLAWIFSQCWQVWRLFSARYFIWSIYHRICPLVHSRRHLDINPWVCVIFGILPLGRGCRNKAWCISPLVLFLEELWWLAFFILSTIKSAKSTVPLQRKSLLVCLLNSLGVNSGVFRSQVQSNVPLLALGRLSVLLEMSFCFSALFPLCFCFIVFSALAVRFSFGGERSWTE